MKTFINMFTFTVSITPKKCPKYMRQALVIPIFDCDFSSFPINSCASTLFFQTIFLILSHFIETNVQIVTFLLKYFSRRFFTVKSTSVRVKLMRPCIYDEISGIQPHVLVQLFILLRLTMRSRNLSAKFSNTLHIYTIYSVI